MRKIFAVLVPITLSACVATSSEPVGPPPENYRTIAAQYLRSSLFDPYSVQDAAISRPRQHNSLSGPKWNVCFRGNARNRLGGYTGLRETLLVIDSGRVIASADDASVNCAGAQYEPFPELAG